MLDISRYPGIHDVGEVAVAGSPRRAIGLPATGVRQIVSLLSRLRSDRGVRTAEYVPFPNMEGRNDRQSSLEIPVMIRALGLPLGGRVLEIGCGRGIGLGAFRRLLNPARLVGLDVDGALLEDAGRRLREAGADAELFRGDARAMPFPDGAFDLVVDFGTCYHIGHPERALAEVERVLAPGGTFVHETRLSQMLSHPVRSMGRAMPLRRAPGLRARRWGVLWTSRHKVDALARRR